MTFRNRLLPFNIPALRSSSTRLAVAVATAFLFAFVLLGAGVYYAVSTLLLNDAREVIRADAAGLLEISRDDGRAALLAEVRDRVESGDDPDAVYAVIGEDGRIVAGSFARLPAYVHGVRWLQFIERNDGGRQRVVANLLRLPSGETLLTGLRTRSQDRFLGLTLRTALAALLAAATLGVLVGWLTLHWVSGRLRSLDNTAARVGAGELTLRAALDGSDDAFDRLARRFNGMLDRIEDLLGGVRHATDHIAHDLRTPLTRLRNRLEELRVQPEGSARIAALDVAISETDQLLQSFGALLRLARIEAQAPARDEPTLDLSALASDALELYTPSAGERGIALRGNLAPCRVHGDADQLFQMLVNLLDNAVKYAPADSVVDVALYAERNNVVLEIADRGSGVPAGDRERVFDRFQRLEGHRGSPGTGLGLSLVRAIVQRHAGQIELRDTTPDDSSPGLRVRVVLPQAEAVV